MKFVVFLAVAMIGVAAVAAEPGRPNPINTKPTPHPRLRREPGRPNPINTKPTPHPRLRREPGRPNPINTKPTPHPRLRRDELGNRNPDYTFPTPKPLLLRREAVAEDYNIRSVRDTRPPPAKVLKDSQIVHPWYHLV